MSIRIHESTLAKYEKLAKDSLKQWKQRSVFAGGMRYRSEIILDLIEMVRSLETDIARVESDWKEERGRNRLANASAMEKQSWSMDAYNRARERQEKHEDRIEHDKA